MGRVVQDRNRRHNQWSGGPSLHMKRMQHTHCGRRLVDVDLDVSSNICEDILRTSRTKVVIPFRMIQGTKVFIPWLSLHLGPRSLGLRWENRPGPRSGPRDPGLEKPWIRGTDLGPVQIPQIHSNRLKLQILLSYCPHCPEGLFSH